MKDQEEYEEYLVDKAKELLNEQMETDEEELATDPDEVSGPEKPEMDQKRNKMDEKAEKDSTSKIPFSWDPREIKHLTENRKKMDNQEMKEFLEKDSEFQEEMEKLDEWIGFSRWEERFMIQNQQTMEPEEMAEELDREEKEVRLKLHMLGVKVDEF